MNYAVIAGTVPILLLGLQGCISAAQEEAKKANDECISAAEASPESKALYARLLRDPKEVPTVEKLNDKAHLSRREKDVFVAVRAKKAPCRDIVLSHLHDYGRFQVPYYREFFRKQDAVALKLVADELTVAQYNLQIVDLNSQFEADLESARTEFNRQTEISIHKSRDEKARSEQEDDPYSATMSKPDDHWRTDETKPVTKDEFGTAFLRSSYKSGTNRICVYNRLGNEEHTTIKAHEICPRTLD